jgi:enamine deaminase RidA (YjgF/YER057c/UK114 family)
MFMQKEFINPPGVLAHPSFSRVITVKGPMKLIFISGQTPQDDDFGCMAPGDMRRQYLFCMEKLSLQLEAAGATWEDVTHRRVYTLNIAALRQVTSDPSIPKPYKNLPCSTMIGVTELSHPDFLVEIDLIAVANE